MDRNMIADIRSFAAEQRASFAMCAIDDDFDRKAAPLFDREFMNALYAYGERKGLSESGCLGTADRGRSGE